MFKKLFASLTGKSSPELPKQEEIVLGAYCPVPETSNVSSKKADRRKVTRVFQHTPSIREEPMYLIYDCDVKAYVNSANPTEMFTEEELRAVSALPMEEPPISTELPKFVQRRTGMMQAYTG